MTRQKTCGLGLAWLCRLTLLLPLLAAVTAHSAQGGQGSECTSGRHAGDRFALLDRVHRVDEFRLFYTLAGPDALTDPADRDFDGVPDIIEDAARQLVAARRVYTELLGFVHPLKQARYRESASGIDVNVVDLGSGAMGRAFDEVRNLQRSIDGKAGTCMLHMALDLRWRPANQTPAHELFHLFQNGYTMFKMRWLSEGTARWAESALGASVPQPGSLPDSEAARSALLSSSYGAAGFWSTLAALSDPDERLPPPWLRSSKYSNGQPLYAGAPMRGAAFIRAMFEAMGRADQAFARERGRSAHAWTEAEQKSPVNDAAAWAAVMQVVRAMPAAPRGQVAVATMLAFDAAHPLEAAK